MKDKYTIDDLILVCETKIVLVAGTAWVDIDHVLKLINEVYKEGVISRSKEPSNDQ